MLSKLCLDVQQIEDGSLKKSSSLAVTFGAAKFNMFIAENLVTLFIDAEVKLRCSIY